MPSWVNFASNACIDRALNLAYSRDLSIIPDRVWIIPLQLIVKAI